MKKVNYPKRERAPIENRSYPIKLIKREDFRSGKSRRVAHVSDVDGQHLLPERAMFVKRFSLARFNGA
jgi:hypothetical protein